MSKWLKCKIIKGMFSDEVTVLVCTRSGEDISVFVPKNFAEEPRSRVKVVVTEQSGRNFAVLPNDTQTVIDVKDRD